MLLNTTVKVRAVIGILQGLALYLLYMALSHKTWPATNAIIFEPLLLIFLFVPVVITLGVHNIRTKTLILWALAAIGVLIYLGAYDAWRNSISSFTDDNFFISPALLFFTIFGLYIANALVASGDADRLAMAHYSTYFDVAWKVLIQVILSSLFLIIFWILLWIGNALFSMINLTFFDKLIRKAWFGIPITTLIFNIGLHITDIKVDLVRGVRTLLLSLLSWLLPLFTILLAGFFLSLFFTGLAPLWKLSYTTSLLFIAAVLLILLINSAYQDGRPIPRILSFFSSFAAVLLLPTVILAIYSLTLYTSHEGWSVCSIFLGAGLIIASFYALGYAFSCMHLKGLEEWNFYAAILILIVLLSILTPVADPIRLSVINQMHRLQLGLTTPEKFNFEFLRWEAGKFGQRALLSLQSESKNPWVRKQAATLLAKRARYETITNGSVIIAHTESEKLPEDFLQHNWKSNPNSYYLPNCLVYATKVCDAWTTSIQNKPGILILDDSTVSAFQEKAPKIWQYLGDYKLPSECKEIIETLRKGKFTLEAPLIPFPDLEVKGFRFYLILKIRKIVLLSPSKNDNLRPSLLWKSNN